MHFLEQFSAQLGLKVLPNALHRAQFAHVNIVVLRLGKEGVALVVARIFARDERETMEVVFVIIVGWCFILI